MEREIEALGFRKLADVSGTRRVEHHAGERLRVRDGRDQDLTIALEADKTAVEQVISIWGKEEPVRSIQALFVRCIAPRACSGWPASAPRG